MYAPDSTLTDPTRSEPARSELRTVFASLVLLFALVIGGCDSLSGNKGSDSSSPSRPGQTEKTLAPGEATATSTGAHFMAPSGGLDSLITVSVERAEDPTAESPLPKEVRSAGTYYRISGDRNLELSTEEQPLYVALPMPESVDPAHAALGVRMPKKYTVGPGSSASGYGWSIAPGAYEPERGLLVVPLRFLLAEGTVFAVLENPDYDSPPMNSAEGGSLFEKAKNFFDATGATSKSGGKTNQSGGKTNRFEVVCTGFSGGGCGASAKRQVRKYLNKAYNDFVPAFGSPDLRQNIFSNKYVWELRKDGTSWCKGNTAGKYLWGTNTAITCYNGSGSPSERTTRHELLHAIQYSHGPVTLPNPLPDWIIEGTAELAENTSTNASNVGRAPTSLRKIDRGLTISNGKPNYSEYRVQDFWTYLINSSKLSPGRILGDLLYGRNHSAANKLGTVKVDMLFDLDQTHWGWVRNQAFESRITAGNSRLNGQCVFNSSAVSGPIQTISYEVTSRSSPLTKSVSVGGLTADVVEVKLKNGSGSKQALATVTANAPSSERYAKIYKKRSSPTSGCLNRGSSSSAAKMNQLLPAGGEKTVYVLLSNSTSDGPASFDLKITHQKTGVKITQPSDGATVTEGDLVDFNAKVQLPGNYNYSTSWSTSGRYAGSGSITEAGTSKLCPGSHDITAKTSVPEMGATFSDQVTIQVKNRRPDLSITSKPSTSKIPKGSKLSLQAKAKDKTCKLGGDAADQSKIKWFVSGTNVGSGQSLFHAVQAAVGSQITAHAQYTDDAGATVTTKTLTFTVTSPPQGSRAPDVQITAPPNQDEITGSSLHLKAKASDPDGGSIKSYKWTVTGGGSGSGRTTKTFTGNDLRIDGLWNKHGFWPGDFFIKVTVTDDDGQQTTTSVQRHVRPGG